MSAAKESNFLRPFYFMVVVWGEQYRNYFLEFCLPSLLSPENIPALEGRRPVKFLVATTAEDWQIICETAVFRELGKHADPVFIELPPKEERPYWLHATIGQKMCCDVAARDKVYRVFVCPDSVFSDGTIARIHQVALEGAEAVLSLVTPLTKTSLFFKMLAQMGLLSERSARDTGIPIVLSTAQVAALAMNAMHGLSRINEWEAPYFCRYASTPWWPVPGESGGVMNGLFWNLLMVDYAAVQHDSSILDARGFDGDYTMHTIGNLETIYFVRDSDELYVVSWAAIPEPPLRKQHGDFGKGIAFRVSAYSSAFNAFQRDTLFMPTFVHAGEHSNECHTVEQKALRTLATWLDTPRDIERYSRALPPHLRNYAGLQAKIEAIPLPKWRSNTMAWAFVRNVIVPLIRLRVRTRIFFINSLNVWRRISLALRGDAASIERLRWHGRRVLAKTLGRPMT